jgi:DNA-binding transcriptional MocR family regulator
MVEDYRVIAQEIADDIDEGRLQPGDRLPPQRTFAFNRRVDREPCLRRADQAWAHCRRSRARVVRALIRASTLPGAS